MSKAADFDIRNNMLKYKNFNSLLLIQGDMRD